MPDAHITPDLALRWRRITAGTLFTGYAGYYICRANLSVIKPLLLNEGYDKAELGLISSAGVLLYALGKISNGLLADFLGGRRMFLLGMAASVACTVVFGLAAGLVAFVCLWACNRYFQSMGWVALVKITGQWYPFTMHATIMGLLSTSYLLGDAFARLYLGSFLRLGVGWRGTFFLAAATLGVIAVASRFLLKSSPRAVGGGEPEANPQNVFGPQGEAARPPGLLALVRPLLASPTFWIICLMNFGLTLIRETFNDWTPTYLYEVGGLSEAKAALWSALVPIVGAASCIGAGLLSDRLGGRHSRVVLPSLVLLVCVLGSFALLPVDGNPLLAVALVAAAAFFLIAPYSFLSGVIALDLGGKQGSATTAGLIDSAGYLGAVLSGYGIGRIARDYGWTAVFNVLAVVAGLTIVTGIAYWVTQHRQ